MKKVMLGIDSRKEEEIIKINPAEKTRSTFQLILIKLSNWIIAYLMFVGILILFQFLTGGIKYPSILKDSAIVLVAITTIIIYGSAISGTKIVVPGGLIVYNEALMNDINAARSRAFNVTGPFTGYLLAILFYLLFEIEST
ncbi:MAG: hypothetical protein HeimC2_40710 [Candidatus Heimdallarchaeota archaeon LC_2]|nr:MAG: hypothetical protein HeimC2_40710 [Candidatus Heimdallarchaeota archaeon LC_2]